MTDQLGRHHPLVKRIRALRGSAAARREQGCFVAEGVHLAQEALRRRARVLAVVYAPELSGSSEGDAILRGARSAGLDLHEVDSGIMDSLQDARSPQPVLVLVRLPEEPEPRHTLSMLGGDELVLLLHGIQDPGNLGGLIRTAHAAGASQVWLDGPACDPFHPRAVRASMGSIFRMPVARDDFEALIPALAKAGLSSWAAGGSGGVDYRRAQLRGGCALVLGSEGPGLPDRIARACDGRVTVPMSDGVESLSVAAAGAVLLFAAARRRLTGG